MKVFIVPPNSLILFDLVERFGHEPLSTMQLIQEMVDNLEIDSPPLNVTPDDVKRGLKYAGIEVPSGIRGRLAVWSELFEQADATIIMEDAPYAFGCVGCHRTNLILNYLLRQRGMPLLELRYPLDDEEAMTMVLQVKGFLGGLK